MLLRGSCITCMILEMFPVWICTAQILHKISQRQVRIYMDDLVRHPSDLSDLSDLFHLSDLSDLLVQPDGLSIYQ